ncbi:MAG: hypothetical protein ACFCD0_28050 [Gemmataceae bacterium]
MKQFIKLLLVVVFALFIHESVIGPSVVLAQAKTNQQRYEELVQSARQKELLGYILGGVGILIVVLAIPIGIYRDRKKKARKRAQKEALERQEE